MRHSTWILATMLACEQDAIVRSNLPASGTYNPATPPALYTTDRVVQVTEPQIDVLWVIDNSCSMAEEQAALADNFDKFIGWFIGSGLDWHVGVTSTDMISDNAKGRLRQSRGVNHLTEAFAQQYGREATIATFIDMAKMGVNGRYPEQGRGAALAAVTEHQQRDNQGFLRDEAALAVIVISDDDDYSPHAQSEYISSFKGLKSRPDLVSYSSIVGFERPCTGWVTEGKKYREVTAALGGLEWDLCDRDWASVLDQLGIRIAGLKREFFLSQTPDVTTIDPWVVEPARVNADGDQIPETTYDLCTEPECGPSASLYFSYDPRRNSITLPNHLPPPLSQIYVNYRMLAAFDPDGEDREPGDTGR
jgi:hypothetical protein